MASGACHGTGPGHRQEQPRTSSRPPPPAATVRRPGSRSASAIQERPAIRMLTLTPRVLGSSRSRSSDRLAPTGTGPPLSASSPGDVARGRPKVFHGHSGRPEPSRRVVEVDLSAQYITSQLALADGGDRRAGVRGAGGVVGLRGRDGHRVGRVGVAVGHHGEVGLHVRRGGHLDRAAGIGGGRHLAIGAYDGAVAVPASGARSSRRGWCTVGVVELAAKNSSNASPARTPVGTVTVWLVRLPLVAAAATKVIGVAGGPS